MSEISEPARTRLRDLRPQHHDGALDWVVITLAIGALSMMTGIGMFVWMFSQREYWQADPTMPSVFIMFSKVINGSTIGVMFAFIGFIGFVAAILVWHLRNQHQRAMDRMDDIYERLGRIVPSANGIKPAVPALKYDTGEYRIVRTRTHDSITRHGEGIVNGLTEYLTAMDDLRHNGDEGPTSVA